MQPGQVIAFAAHLCCRSIESFIPVKEIFFTRFVHVLPSAIPSKTMSIFPDISSEKE